MDTLAKYRSKLAELEAAGQLRGLRTTVTLPEGKAWFEGREYLNFSGNDYLGVAGDEALREEFFHRYAETLPHFAATGSRLLGGDSPAHRALEATLEKLYGKSALLFNSGYHANIGILPALTDRDSLVLADKLVHASIIDGLSLCRCDCRRYRHLDHTHLETLLAAAEKEGKRCFIVTESVFSMDGDLADLAGLVKLKNRYHAMLIVDEAHAVGVLGENGLGRACELGLLDQVDVLVGTFDKAFGSAGAFCVADSVLKNFLINTMRPFIFSTALPPIVAMWSNFVLEKMPHFEEKRRKLASLHQGVRAAVAKSPFLTLGNSQIVPVIAGENEQALALAEKFRKHGMLAFAVRPPTVPAGSSRLRLSLSAAMPENTPERIEEALKS